MSIYHNLEQIKLVALEYAKKHNCNYNIILANPNEAGNFAPGSTYEFVADSYFEKPRPHVKLLYKTDDLLQAERNKVFENPNNTMVITDQYKDIYQEFPILKKARIPFGFRDTKNTKPSTNNRKK